MNKLVAYRKKRKMSQEELSLELGISQGYLSKVETGALYPNYWFLRELFMLDRKLAIQILDKGIV